MSDIERAIGVILDLREEVLKLREFTREENDKSSEALELLRDLEQYRAIGTLDKCQAYKRIAELHFSNACADMKIIDELREYKNIGTPDECRAAVEKQRAKKPIYNDANYCLPRYECPICGETVSMNEDACSNCGQRIQRGSENETD